MDRQIRETEGEKNRKEGKRKAPKEQMDDLWQRQQQQPQKKTKAITCEKCWIKMTKRKVWLGLCNHRHGNYTVLNSIWTQKDCFNNHPLNLQPPQKNNVKTLHIHFLINIKHCHELTLRAAATDLLVINCHRWRNHCRKSSPSFASFEVSCTDGNTDCCLSVFKGTVLVSSCEWGTWKLGWEETKARSRLLISPMKQNPNRWYSVCNRFPKLHRQQHHNLAQGQNMSKTS